MRRKTLYVILGMVVVVAVIGVIVWRSQPSAGATEDLRSAVVERGTMLVAVSASGRVEPRERVNLAFEVAGPIAEVPVAVGDRVATGDVLARLDAERLELQVKQAEASLASAEAQLAKLRAGPRTEEIRAVEANVRAAKAQVNAADAERDQVEAGASQVQTAAAEADLASAITRQKKAQDAHDATLKCVTVELPAGKVIELPGGDVITITQSVEKTVCPALGVPEEQARYNLQAANEALEAARARLDEALAGADQDQLRAAQANVEAAVAQRDAAQAQLDLLRAGAAEEQIAAAEARVVQAQVALKQIQLSLGQATLRAPFDGVVAEVNIKAGERTSVGMPAVTLIDTSRYRVTVGVDEMDVSKLSRGKTAQVTLEALPEAVVTGTVEHIAPAAALDRGVVTYDVTIELAPTDAPIRADMTANTTIVVEELANVLKIPVWVVRVDRDTGQTYVHRRVGDEIKRVDVKLGVRHESVVQVLEGLSETDEVVRVQEGATFDFSDRGD